MKSIFLFLISFSVVMVSCKQDPKRKVSPISKNENTDLNKTNTNSEVTFKTDKHQLLFADYLALKGAFVNTDVYKVQNAAKRISNDFKKDTTFFKIQQVSVLIAQEEDIKKQREFFVGLTEEVFKELTANVKDGKLYQQFCPMAFEGRGGYWLSDSEEIRNPYYGDEMLVCGYVKETIK